MTNIALAHGHASFDVNAVRRQFPVLARMVRGKPLAYLDNGASAQRPLAVIDAVDDYERHHHANIHRGVHTLSQEATALYETARDRLVQFINARSRHEVIFVRGTTEAINLVAQSYARPRLVPGDEILITHLEHHANIVPWQMVCEQTGATLVVVPIDSRGEVHEDAVVALMSPRTRLFACAHVSNALGTVLDRKSVV
jgi:cysteine desulfurase / selenocysteine lyase